MRLSACTHTAADLAPSCGLRPWRQQRGRGRAKRAQRMLIPLQRKQEDQSQHGAPKPRLFYNPLAHTHSLCARRPRARSGPPEITPAPTHSHSPCTFPS